MNKILGGTVLLLGTLAGFSLFYDNETVERVIAQSAPSFDNTTGVATHANRPAGAEHAPVDGSPSTNTVLELYGVIVARRQATVSSQQTGIIEELFVDEGAQVSEGQVLARLNSRADAIQTQRARDQLAAAQLELDRALIEAEFAEKELARVQQMIEDKLASEKDIDSARYNAEIARADVEKIRRDLAVYQDDIAYQEEILEQFVVRAPFSGTIVTRHAEVGEVVSVTANGSAFIRTGIFTLADSSSLEIQADVTEATMHRIRPGQEAVASLWAYPESELKARVISAGPSGNADNGRFKLRVALVDSDARVSPNMIARLRFFDD